MSPVPQRQIWISPAGAVEMTQGGPVELPDFYDRLVVTTSERWGHETAWLTVSNFYDGVLTGVVLLADGRFALADSPEWGMRRRVYLLHPLYDDEAAEVLAGYHDFADSLKDGTYSSKAQRVPVWRANTFMMPFGCIGGGGPHRRPRSQRYWFSPGRYAVAKFDWIGPIPTPPALAGQP